MAGRAHEVRAGMPFLLLTALFVAALVTCNLIANKFVAVDLGFLGFGEPFIVSAGILPYPMTFLVTDLLSEVYGRRKANQVVVAGFAASLFVLLMLWLGHQFPAIESTIVDDETYARVFRNAWRVIGASMVAYLTAQFVDIRMFHFWKDLTNGRHLWLRNNFSTWASQLVDTALVVSVLFVHVEDPVTGEFGTDWADVGRKIRDGWLFKVLCAAADTPLFYVGVWLFERHLPAEGRPMPVHLLPDDTA